MTLPSPLLPHFLSHSFTSPLIYYTPSNSSHPLFPVTQYFSLSFSLSLSLFPTSFNSIRGQGPTSLPLHPHLLSVFFSRWCNSAVRCRGHHKLTRSLITVDLMSGKERGREKEERGRHRERWRERAHLHICLETWLVGSGGGRMAEVDADIIIIAVKMK